jgi:hypothetical protein
MGKLRVIAIMALVVALSAGATLGFGTGLARADTRVALIVGNSAYKSVPALRNPLNDATDFADKIKNFGFQVFGGYDLDRSSMIRELTAFGRAAENADVALVFYAGHGIQMNGQNYLVPVDANIEYEAEVDLALVPFNLVMQQLNRGSRVNIAILDACRDNPFARSLSRTMGTRAVELGRGLSRAPTISGSFIAYSTQPDNVAMDGAGRNSPFASALLKFLETPNLSLPDLMIAVRKQVMAETNGKQVPWDSSSLTGSFSFKVEGTVTIAPQDRSRPPTPADSQQPDSTALELAVWNAIKASKDPEPFKRFVKEFPNGIFEPAARERIETIDRLRLIANTKWSGEGASATLDFGGPPYCRYSVLMKDIVLSVSIDASGQVEAATVDAVMIENAIPPCRFAPIGENRHRYSGTGSTNGTEVELQLAAAAGNDPQAAAVFKGVQSQGRLVGQLVFRRLGRTGNLAWTVSASMK